MSVAADPTIDRILVYMDEREDRSLRLFAVHVERNPHAALGALHRYAMETHEVARLCDWYKDDDPRSGYDCKRARAMLEYLARAGHVVRVHAERTTQVRTYYVTADFLAVARRIVRERMAELAHRRP